MKYDPLNCNCGDSVWNRGYHPAACVPSGYKWAAEKLSAAFGEDNVRISILTNFERKLSIGVFRDEGNGVALLYDADGYDLNDNKLDLDLMIDQLKSGFQR